MIRPQAARAGSPRSLVWAMTPQPEEKRREEISITPPEISITPPENKYNASRHPYSNRYTYLDLPGIFRLHPSQRYFLGAPDADGLRAGHALSLPVGTARGADCLLIRGNFQSR